MGRGREHAIHEAPGTSLAVAWLGWSKSIDQHESPHVLGSVCRDEAGDGATHGVTQQVRRAPKVLDKPHDIG